MSEEDRRFPRLPSHLSVLVRNVEEGGVEELAHTTAIALGGCSFVSNEQVAKGARLEILIALENDVIKAQARAVYDRPLDDGRREVGVEFLDLDGAAMRYINNLFERPRER
jgi:c-di-GMP-binding flagellar brake protein YcgR